MGNPFFKNAKAFTVQPEIPSPPNPNQSRHELELVFTKKNLEQNTASPSVIGPQDTTSKTAKKGPPSI